MWWNLLVTQVRHHSGHRQESAAPHISQAQQALVGPWWSVNWGFSLWVDGTGVKTREDILRPRGGRGGGTSSSSFLLREREPNSQPWPSGGWHLSAEPRILHNTGMSPSQPGSTLAAHCWWWPDGLMVCPLLFSLGFRQHFNCRENDPRWTPNPAQR